MKRKPCRITQANTVAHKGAKIGKHNGVKSRRAAKRPTKW